MSLLVKDRSFYKKVLSLAVPATFQSIINFGVSLAGTVMLGRLGEEALSAASLANQFGYLFMVLSFGIANGAFVLIAQYWGRKDTDHIGRLVGQALKTAIAVALVFTVVALGFPQVVMRVFTPDAALQETGVEYLRVAGFSYVFVAVSNCLSICLRGVEVLHISVLATGASFALSAGLGYLLIFGKGGMPALGVQGAAIAMLAARAVECVILICYAAFFDKRLNLTWRRMVSAGRALRAAYARSAAPMIASEMMLGLGISAQVWVLARLGEGAVAAGSICATVQQLITVFVYGLSNASAVTIGKVVGKGEFLRAHQYAKTLQVCYLFIGLLCGIIMFSTRDAVLAVYNLTESTRILARQFLAVQSVVVMLTAYSAPCTMGLLCGGGDAKFVAKLDLVAIWCAALPLGMAAGFLLHFPAPFVYLLLKTDEPVKGACAFFRLKSTKWMRDVTQ